MWLVRRYALPTLILLTFCGNLAFAEGINLDNDSRWSRGSRRHRIRGNTS